MEEQYMPEEISQEMIDEIEAQREEESEDADEDRNIMNQEFTEGYGYPEPEEKFNQHTFLTKSLDHYEPEKVTYLNQYELGRPLFTVRFLLDLEDVCKHYLDKLCEELEVKNKIAQYFREKIINVSSSGMSNEGFVQNLNVTKKMDSTRHRIRNPIANLKGGNPR